LFATNWFPRAAPALEFTHVLNGVLRAIAEPGRRASASRCAASGRFIATDETARVGEAPLRRAASFAT
jgi:hypothetical protein